MTKPATHKTDRIDLDRLVKIFDLPTWEKVDESNCDFIAQAGSAAAKEREKDLADEDLPEEAREQEMESAREKAEQAAQEEVYRSWYGAVTHAAEQLFSECGLSLDPVKRRIGSKWRAPDRPTEFRVCPETSWSEAASAIMQAVNGDGYCGTFPTLKDFLDSGPYTPRQAVLSHLGWIARRPAVYGSSSAQRLYESHWR